MQARASGIGKKCSFEWWVMGVGLKSPSNLEGKSLWSAGPFLTIMSLLSSLYPCYLGSFCIAKRKKNELKYQPTAGRINELCGIVRQRRYASSLHSRAPEPSSSTNLLACPLLPLLPLTPRFSCKLLPILEAAALPSSCNTISISFPVLSLKYDPKSMALWFIYPFSFSIASSSRLHPPPWPLIVI